MRSLYYHKEPLAPVSQLFTNYECYLVRSNSLLLLLSAQQKFVGAQAEIDSA